MVSDSAATACVFKLMAPRKRFRQNPGSRAREGYLPTPILASIHAQHNNESQRSSFDTGSESIKKALGQDDQRDHAQAHGNRNKQVHVSHAQNSVLGQEIHSVHDHRAKRIRLSSSEERNNEDNHLPQEASTLVQGNDQFNFDICTDAGGLDPDVHNNSNTLSGSMAVANNFEQVKVGIMDDINHTQEQHGSSVPLIGHIDSSPVIDGSECDEVVVSYPEDGIGTVQKDDAPAPFQEISGDVKHIETQRLLNVLAIIEYGGLSENQARRLLKTSVVRSRYSYDSIINYVRSRSGVRSKYGFMCNEEHAPYFGKYMPNLECPSSKCNLPLSAYRRYWYKLLSEQISSLCRERDSLQELLHRCKRPYNAVATNEENEVSYLPDFYHGTYFRNRHGERIRNWREDDELYVFLSFSSDGVEVRKGRKVTKSLWPLMFTISSYSPENRFKAANVLLPAFVRGQHDTELFESFLSPLIDDIVHLQNGVRVRCNDGKLRTVYAHLVFITADWPAASKLLGIKGHNAERPCRKCHKKAGRTVGGGTHLWMIPEPGNVGRVRRINLQRSPELCINLECNGLRTAEECARTWKKLERAPSQAEKQVLMKNTGIKHRPLLRKLNLDIVQCAPYDPMHQWLLGWVKHLLALTICSHPKCDSSKHRFLIQQGILDIINDTLSVGYKGISAVWGRSPESFKHLGGFKAEDFQNLALFYGPCVFNDTSIDTRITKIWSTTSKITYILFDTTPRRNEIARLRNLVVQLHSMFVDFVFDGSSTAFCLTPTTYSILHFPEMLQECEPLRNVSQFIVERVAGTLTEMRRSTQRPEANLFHKTHTLFGLHLLGGGMGMRLEEDGYKGESGYDQNCADSERHSLQTIESQEECEESLTMGVTTEPEGETVAVKVMGARRRVAGLERMNQVKSYVLTTFPITVFEVEVLSLHLLPAISITTKDACLTIESQAHFLHRERQDLHKPRQRCWIAAHLDSGGTDDSNASFLSPFDVYYGVVDEILQTKFSYRSPGEQLKHTESRTLCRVNWMYGLLCDRLTGQTYTRLSGTQRRGTVRDARKTVEDIKCVKKNIGVMDFNGRRTFFDPLGD